MLRHVHRSLAQNGVQVKHAVFCTNVTYKDATTKPGTSTGHPRPPFPSPHLLCVSPFYLPLPILTKAAELANSNVDPEVVTRLTLQNALAEAWRALEPDAEAVVKPSVEEAVKYLADKGELQVFVTGSFHLVGGALSVLEGEDSGLRRAAA